MSRLLLILTAIVFAGAALADRRVALVIGNERYETLRDLENPRNDARAVEDVLLDLGFEVIAEANRDLARLRQALAAFEAEAAGADLALFYFAGHGMEVAGRNLLMPTDADAGSPERLAATSLPLEDVAGALRRAARAGIVIADACRSAPFGSETGSRGSFVMAPEAEADALRPGLGRMGRADGLLFAFAAAPGDPALDGEGGNSPFTGALARHLATGGVEIRSALTLVQQDVYDRTRGRQLPYVESGLPELVFLQAAGDLTERDRLLLAMADLDTGDRDAVETTAARFDVPLAPLYGALLSAGLGDMAPAERDVQLAEAAEAYRGVRDELRRLASEDAEVGALRAAAQQDLDLGLVDAAREKLTQAAEIDAEARAALIGNYVDRTLSQAASHRLSAGAAAVDLQRRAAIEDYARAVTLYEELRRLDPGRPVDPGLQVALDRSGGLYLALGEVGAARARFAALLEVSRARLSEAPEDRSARKTLAVAYAKLATLERTAGDIAAAAHAARAALALREEIAADDPTRAARLNLALAQDKLALISREQGDLDAARTALEAALALRTALAAEDPSDSAARDDLAESHNRLGDLALDLGRLDLAEEHYGAALRLARALAEEVPGETAWFKRLALAQDKIGDVAKGQGDYARARAAYAKAAELRQALLDADPENAELLRSLWVSQLMIGDVHRNTGELAKAAEVYAAALVLAERHAGIDAENADAMRDLMVTQTRLGDVAHWSEDLETARARFAGALDTMMGLAALDPGNAVWQRDLSVSYRKLGSVEFARGDLAAAGAAFKASFDIIAALAERDPQNAGWQFDLALAHYDLGKLAQQERDRPTALERHRAGLEIAERLSAQDPDNVTWAWHLVVANYRVSEVSDDPKPSLARALELAEALDGQGRIPAANKPWLPWLQQEARRLGVR